jgi:hypothetical protein
MDLNKLSNGDKVIGVSSILLILLSFFPWFGKDYFGGSYSENGWDQFPFGVLAILLTVAMLVVVIVKAFTEVELPDKVGNLGWGQILLIAGAIVAGFLVLLLLIGAKQYGTTLDRKWAGMLATLAGIGLLAGGFLKMQEDKAGETGGGAPPPPAPPAPPVA